MQQCAFLDHIDRHEHATGPLQCEREATYRVLKRSTMGDVEFFLCGWHYDQTGPHQRGEKLKLDG